MKQPGDQQADRDIFNIDNKGTVTVINQPVSQRSRSESLLLQAVKQEVISRLDQSLHNAVFINLSKQSQPQQVKRPWDAEIKIGSKSPEALPAETTILEVFDRPGIAGRLLILGEPGAGKTTTMLDLAGKLCDRAEQNATAFIPVLLNLSSWKDLKQTITAWLVEELKSKYGVRKDVGTQWLAEKQLLPLLDGLDEVKPEHQESCVQAINRWLESDDRPPLLAVCCRREEYEKVVRGQWQAETEEPQDETRMHLNGAILLQTLTDEQIQAYLTAANQPELWQMLRHDKALWELIRTPLWLSITLLSYEGLSLTQWQQTTSTEQRLFLLLDAYVERMLHRHLEQTVYKNRKPPNAKQTRHWLVFLAKQLQEESQTEFLIEKLQPSWLKTTRQQWTYRQVHALIGMLIVGLSSPGGRTIGKLGHDQVGGLDVELKGSEMDEKLIPNQGIWKSAVDAALMLLISGLISGLIGGLVVGLAVGLNFGLNFGLISGLIGGLRGGLIGSGQACIQHFALRWILFRSGNAPWNYARFLDYCTERLFLQRVGGRYRFIHKSLQEHFARMGNGEWK